MNHHEKLLLFRFCGIVLWTLKELVIHSQIEPARKQKIIQKLISLIKEVTDCINELYKK